LPDGKTAVFGGDCVRQATASVAVKIMLLVKPAAMIGSTIRAMLRMGVLLLRLRILFAVAT
jgi:hypothetical protein